jgi:dTDP-4-dehydrorhamnose reductase
VFPVKLLVIGGGGLLGTRLVEQAKDSYEVYATYVTRKPSLEEKNILQLDKRKLDEVHSVMRKVEPDVVIDTGALHNVDYCETNRAEARAVNVDGTRNIALAANEQGSRVIYISTDFVFDGNKGGYLEEDKPNPINYYGVTKFEAEKVVSQTCESYAVARPSVIYGTIKNAELESSSGKPVNFAIWLIQKLRRKEAVKIVTDQYASPTLADASANAILTLARSDLKGVYHASGATRLSRYEFALKIAEAFGFDGNLIGPITSNELQQKAKRPPDSSLNVDKIRRELDVSVPAIDDALTQFKKQYEGQRS